MIWEDCKEKKILRGYHIIHSVRVLVGWNVRLKFVMIIWLQFWFVEFHELGMSCDVISGGNKFVDKFCRVESVVGEFGVALVRIWGVVALVFRVNEIGIGPRR